WRPETNTFHFDFGEATMTLQDVQVLFGLPINGAAVVGVTVELSPLQWREKCKNLLGFEPYVQDPSSWEIAGQWLNIGPLERSCKTELQEGQPDIVYEQRARALILWCIGSFIFPDHRADGVSLYWLQLLEDFDGIQGYSWGSALLAGVYRALAISYEANQKWLTNCVQLIQVWAWEHIPRIRPTMKKKSLFDTVPDCPLGGRWVGPRSKSNIATTLSAYRDQLTRLREDQ
ncbi:Serine/threonine-protein phosphatase 7 long form homolog, partial [Striga hermonthica]